MITLVRGWLSLLPVPDSCRVLRAGGRVKGRAAPACGAAGALDAAVGERIMQGGRGQGVPWRCELRFSGSGGRPFCAE